MVLPSPGHSHQSVRFSSQRLHPNVAVVHQGTACFRLQPVVAVYTEWPMMVLPLPGHSHQSMRFSSQRLHPNVAVVHQSVACFCEMCHRVSHCTMVHLRWCLGQSGHQYVQCGSHSGHYNSRARGAALLSSDPRLKTVSECHRHRV